MEESRWKKKRTEKEKRKVNICSNERPNMFSYILCVFFRSLYVPVLPNYRKSFGKQVHKRRWRDVGRLSHRPQSNEFLFSCYILQYEFHFPSLATIIRMLNRLIEDFLHSFFSFFRTFLLRIIKISYTFSYAICGVSFSFSFLFFFFIF